MRRVLIVLSSMTGFLAFLFVVSPLLAPEGTYLGLDGSPMYIDHSWGPSDVAYFLGDLLCHQMEDRCFVLNGSQMPVCIRDLGLLAGFTAGAAACIPVAERLHSRRVLVIAVALMSATVVEWIVETGSGDFPMARLATAIISGAGVALLLSWMLNQNMKRNEQALA